MKLLINTEAQSLCLWLPDNFINIYNSVFWLSQLDGRLTGHDGYTSEDLAVKVLVRL